MVRSMTGFARVRETIGSLEVVLSLKSVNHRGLDLHFYMGSDFDPFENAMRTLVKQQVARGHLDIRVQASSTATAGTLTIDEARVRGYITAFHALREQLGISADLDVHEILRVPGMLTEAGATPGADEGMEASLLAMLDRAVEQLNEFRTREGEELARVMLEQNRGIQDSAERMRGLRARALPAFQARLREKLSDLLASASIDPQRLVQEAAMLADRSDIGEEISRLTIHCAQVEKILQAGNEAGKKLDFLLQEMNRETNTILSKTAGAGEIGLTITELALDAKSRIEKIREQSLNLE